MDHQSMALFETKISRKKKGKFADRVQIYEKGISAQYFALLHPLLFRTLLMMNQSIHQREKKTNTLTPIYQRVDCERSYNPKTTSLGWCSVVLLKQKP